MPDFTIVTARPYHCGQMMRRLRHEHQQAVIKIGARSHQELRDCFAASSYRRAWLIDGNLAALGGVTGTAISATGFVWLALTEQATHYPIAIVKEAKRQLDHIMLVKRELVTTILPGDEAAKRLAIYLGFHVADHGPGASAGSRLARRALARYIDGDPDLRLLAGAGFVVPMGYHAERESA